MGQHFHCKSLGTYRGSESSCSTREGTLAGTRCCYYSTNQYWLAVLGAELVFGGSNLLPLSAPT